MKKQKKIIVLFLLLHFILFSQSKTIVPSREHISIDHNWQFAFGHPFDTTKDFNTGTGYFSYLAKIDYGDGAASQYFDDRSWRNLDLPHDWAVSRALAKKQVTVTVSKI